MMNKVEMNDTMMEQVNGGSVGKTLVSTAWKAANVITFGSLDGWEDCDCVSDGINEAADLIDSGVDTVSDKVTEAKNIVGALFSLL